MRDLPFIPISLLVFLSGVMGALPACAQLSTGGEADATPSTTLVRAAQVIIKFRDAHVDPSQSGFLGEISRDAGAALIHVRPMSGGAHVLRLADPVELAEIDRIIGRLRKRQDVEYVEPDRPMRHMRRTTH